MDEAVQKLFNATPEELGQAAVNAAEKTCKCYWCTVISPKIKQVSDKLQGEDLNAFEFLMNHYGHLDMDLDVAEAKLEGSWPGWEAMKDFKPTPQ